jgi:peptide/nickel transport system substrate-binding protein
MKRSYQIAIAVVIIVVVVVGAAWYALAPPYRPVTPTTETTQATQATQAVTSTTASPAAPSLLSATFANVPNLDPAIGSDEASSAAFVNLYDSLVYPAQVTGEPMPSVATSWTTSSDGLTWTFSLRTDVKFHDGTPLTADDVVFSMNRMLAMGQGYSYLFTPYVNKVSAPDAKTVVVVLKEPIGPFLGFMVRIYVLNSRLVTSHFVTPGPYGANGDYGSKWVLTNDAGSGPYQLTDVKLEAYVTMARFKDYWGQVAANAPDQFKIVGTDAAATVKTLISTGGIDITDRWQSTEALDAMSKMPGVSIVTIPTSAEFYLMMNTKKPPTDDLNFRAALTYAFDYQTVTKNIWPSYHQAAGPVPTALPGHDPDAIQYQRDLTKAMEYLKKSKYYGQLDKYPIVYHWIAEVPDEEKVALLFADNMKDIGVTVQVVKVPWLTVVDEMGKLDTSPNIVTIFVEASYAEAGSIMIQRYHSHSTGTWEQNEWLQNATIDKMLDDAVATVDRTQRFQKYIKAQEVLQSMFLSIYVVDQSEVRAYYAGYVDWYAAKGQNNPILGYNWDVRLIGFNADKKRQMFPGS